MNKPKICVLIDWYLPGTKAGGPVRSVYSLVGLLKPYFDFYIITTNCDLGEARPYQDIEPNTLFTKEDVHYYYFSSQQLNSEQVLLLLKTINPHLVYLNSFWSRYFSINIVRLKSRKEIPCAVLLAPRGMLGKGALGLKAFKKMLFLTLANLFGWYKSIQFHATQDQEKKDILCKFRSANVLVAPNVNSGSVVRNKSSKQPNNLKLFYLSRIARVKNLHFALEVLRDIPSGYSIEYDIYGNLEDTAYWKYCETIIKQLPTHIKVNYKKELPFNEVQQVICEYHCLFLPTLNENFGHAIVESLLCGCPVIISDQTPWNDLEQNDSGYAIRLNDTKKFKEALIAYARCNQTAFSEKSQKAINYISEKINLEQITRQYKTLFNESIKNGSVNL